MRLSAALLALVLLVAACTDQGRITPYRAGAVPGWPKIGAALPAGHTRYSNRSLARLFTMLTHDLEWGASRPNLVRYETPVRVAMTGPGSDQYATFLDGYLGLVQRETGVDIDRATGRGNLHIRFVEGPAFRQALPTISCFVISGDASFADFRTTPERYGGARLEAATTLTQTTIFIPQTAAPYLVRSCLIEEIAQALGPANDLYGLGPSIFNDDAAHTWPTRLDHLMLRVLYAPELATGLDRSETTARAWAALDRLNPKGVTAPDLDLPQQQTMATWRGVTQKIFSRKADATTRRQRADEALRLARANGQNRAYECHSALARGRILVSADPKAAVKQLTSAENLCAEVHGADDIRIARIQLERASAELRLRRFQRVINTTEGLDSRFAAHGLDERLATLYALRSNAFRAIQQGTKSFEARRNAKSWGEYALGIDNEALTAWLER